MLRILLGCFLAMSTFPVEGGVDFVTHSIFAEPGTLSDCCNFERGVGQGATRIDGVMPFDGSFESLAFYTATLEFALVLPNQSLADSTIADFEAESSVVVSLTQSATVFDAEVTSSSVSFVNPVYIASITMTGKVSVNSVPAAEFGLIQKVSDGTTYSAYRQGFPILSGNYGQCSVNPSVSPAAEETANTATPVPGRTDSDVHFTHMYKDDVYCARDYEAYTIRGTNGARTMDPMNGDTIATLTAQAQVVKVDGQFGLNTDARVIVHNERGKFAVDDTIYGVARGHLHKPMCSGGFCAPMATFLHPGAMTEIGKVIALTDETEAGLFKSSPSGWREVDQLSEVKFRLGLSSMDDLVGTIRESQISTSITVADTGLMFGTNSRNIYKFTSTSAVLADDASYTGCSTSDSTFEPGCAGMLVSGFQTGIPTNATIIGVEVEIQRKADINTASENVQDLQIALVNVGTKADVCTAELRTLSADNKASVGERWTTEDVTKTYGGPTDLWGQAIPASAILSPDFGVFVGINRQWTGGTYAENAQIDYIKVKVYYLAATNRVYFYNSALNLVPNGTFDSGASWTLGGGTWVIGSEVLTGTACSTTATSTLAAVSGRSYRITYTITRTAGSVQVTFGGASGTSRTASGTYTDELVTTTTAALVITGAAFTGTVDNVFVFDVSPGAQPANVVADVVQVHVLNGRFDDNDATGVLTVRAATDASAGRVVGAGDVISALENGVTPYATVSSPLVQVTLPSQEALDAEESQYRAINANFYASEDYEAAYIVNGAGPAFAIERNGVIRIHPDLTSDLNKPRHVAKHADLLALAYPNGSVLFSVEGSPYNMNGFEGAFEWAFGDRVTGIFPMAKDSLGVLCQSSITALAGRTEETMQPNVVSAKTGAIEYAAVDMGFLVFVDSFGITTIDTTDRYGDFVAGRLSFKAWPWLRPRVQALSSDSTLRVKLAYPVRNKNQLRVVFADGWGMSVSFVGPDREPHIYLHRFHYDNGTEDSVFVPRHVSSGVDSRGVERIFGTMAYAPQWNLDGQQFVYEFDKLWFMTFWDSATEAFIAKPIQSYIVTNWNDERDPDGVKRFESFGIYGRSQFPVTFQAGRAVNYGLTTNSSGVADVMIDVTFGTSGEIVPPIAYNRKTTAHLAIEGEDIALRFESETADTPPFTISAITLPYDSRGKTRGQRI